MVFVVVVRLLVAFQIGAQLVFHAYIGGLGGQHIPVLGGVGAGGNSSKHTVSQRHHRGKAGLQGHQQQRTAQGNHHAHGMPLDKSDGVFRDPARRDRRFLGCPGARFRRFPGTLGIFPFLLLLLPIAGENVFLELWMLPGLLLHLILGLGPNVPPLPAAHTPGRCLPDTPPDSSCPGAAHPFSGELHPMGCLHAHVFVLDLMDLPMNKAVDLMTCGGSGELRRAGTLGGPLGSQLFLGGFQPGPSLFRLFARFLKPLIGLGVSRLLLSARRGLVLPPQTGGRTRPLALLIELAPVGLRAMLARSCLITRRHSSYPPGAS